jgi:hypothetical protein
MRGSYIAKKTQRTKKPARLQKAKRLQYTGNSKGKGYRTSKKYMR